MDEFKIRPNNSLSPRGLFAAAVAFGLLLGLIALRFALMGFWLLVPFLLADFLAVAAAFYFIRKRGAIHESVQIDGQQLLIQHHETHKAKSWAFDLHWVKIDLQKHAHPWQPSRLLLGSHGKWIELANFLTNEERASLFIALKQSIQSQKYYA